MKVNLFLQVLVTLLWCWIIYDKLPSTKNGMGTVVLINIVLSSILVGMYISLIFRNNKSG